MKWWMEKKLRDNIKPRQSATVSGTSETEIESPRPLNKETSFDSQMFFGQDSSGNFLLLRLTRHQGRIAEVWLNLQLSDGRTFTLPDHPDTQATSDSDESFSAAGLTLEYLVPMISWRLRYNGLLRQGVRTNWTEDLKEKELVPVKLNFLWKAKSRPLYWPLDWSTKLMAASASNFGGDPMRCFADPECKGFDQYGAMLGEVFLNHLNAEKEHFEINLPGIRQRRWGGTPLISELSTRGSLIGVCADGMVFNVGAFNGSGMKHAQFGTVYLISGSVASIEWTDFELANFEDPVKPQTIQFGVGKMSFKVQLNCSFEGKFSLVGQQPIGWKNDCYKSKIQVNGVNGNGIALFWSPSSEGKIATPPQLPLYRRVQYSSQQPDAQKFIYHFNDKEASSVSISGGKGASLALLTSIAQMKDFVVNDGQSPLKLPEFTVPNGFVLSVSAMDAMLRINQSLDRNIQELVEICATGKEIKEKCAQIKEQIESLHLSDEIRGALEAALKQVNSSNSSDIRIAVRSSSVCEDGEDVSAAGQNDTFLGLRSVDDILTAVKRCWASLYSPLSVQYRKQNIQPIRTGMAVVVQTMLAADCAGVLFSQHPITGDRKQCLISANYGLGESVVSGEVDPDNFVIQRSHRDDKLTIVERVCGQKGHKIQMTEDNNVEKVAVDGAEFCVSDQMVLKLTEIGVMLEKLYGNGRDIEWGLKGDCIYLLQSRPITSLNQFSDWEFTHEFDTPIMSEEDLCTTATVQEVMPGTIGPLTNHYILGSMEKTIIKQMGEMGVGNVSRFNKMMIQSRYHVFMDVFSVYFMDPQPEVKLHERMNSVIMSGCDVITAEINSIALKRAEAKLETPKKMRLIKSVLRECWNYKKTTEDALSLVKSFSPRYAPENLHKFQNAFELFTDIEQSLDVLIEICGKHCGTSVAHAVCNRIIMVLLTEDQEELSEQIISDYRLISSSAKDTVSADIPKKLEQMAKGVFISGKKEEFCGIDPEEGVEWLKKNLPEVHSIFEEFLTANSHRGREEYNLVTVTWGMRPAIIIDMLQSLLRLAPNVESLGKTNEVTELTPDELMQRLSAPKGFIKRRIMKWVISWSHTAVQYREEVKSCYINVINRFRLAFCRLGELMAQEGFLPSQDLIFYMTGDELRLVFESRDVNVIKKATRRQKLIPQLKKDKFGDIVEGVPRPINSKKDLKFESGTEIRGTPVYGGLVTGRACVIDFADVSKIEPGDILITYSTDIGWSPYFPILGGVVTEIGGLISHGAVVAREYGLPCIVAATNASDFFTFGEIVTLDSEKGVIFKGTGN